MMAIYRWKEDEKVTAEFDIEKENRYLLNCSWDVSKPSVTFLLINPSNGTEECADCTLRRCVNFSKKMELWLNDHS